MSDTKTRASAGPDEPAGVGTEGTAGALDPGSTTVRDALRLRPGADEVFHRFGIDTCCGGDLPLEEAAEHHGVDLEALLEALSEVDAGGS